MAKAQRSCLFGNICDPKDYDVDGCPFSLSEVSFKKKVIPVNCSTWDAHRKSMKERRLDYAEKAKHRRAIERSEGQVRDVTA